MIYSFDVFDTLITRITYTPAGIFDLMQKKLEDNSRFSECFLSNFASIRIESEKQARYKANTYDKEEISIEDIYTCMQEFSNLSDSDIRMLIGLEIDTELKCVVPIKNNINDVKRLLNEGNRVILISDMYLHTDIIRKMLTSIDSIFEKMPIYVSCDYNMTKCIGTLYTYIKNELSINYCEWVHVGDNHISDYLIPKTLGIDCKPYKAQGEYAFMNFCNCVKYSNILSLEIYKGIIKNTRCVEDSAKRQLGNAYAGIILWGYGNWIIDNAIAEQRKKLYFIARDGYVIKKVVDTILEYKNIDIQTYYIFGSRKAWRVNEEEKKNLLIDYFKSNVDFNSNIAFVDAYGFGISISMVAETLKDVWKETVPVYYFCIHRHVESEKCKFYNYCYCKTDLMELLSSATYGTTLGYERKNGGVYPIIEKGVSSEDIEDYVAGVMDYLNAMLHVQQHLNISLDVRAIVNVLVNNVGYERRVSLEELWDIINGTNKYILHTDNGFEKKEKNDVFGNKLLKDNIIIYGAGKIGKQVYNVVKRNKNYNIIAWTDIDYIGYESKGLPIKAIREALSKKYDYIVLALRNKTAIKSAKCILKELGVSEYNIHLIDDMEGLYSER